MTRDLLGMAEIKTSDGNVETVGDAENGCSFQSAIQTRQISQINFEAIDNVDELMFQEFWR